MRKSFIPLNIVLSYLDEIDLNFKKIDKSNRIVYEYEYPNHYEIRVSTSNIYEINFIFNGFGKGWLASGDWFLENDMYERFYHINKPKLQTNIRNYNLKMLIDEKK